MINQYIVNSVPLTLASDLAGEFPLYLYLAIDKQTLFYSESITELLNEQRIPKPLKVSAEGLSFLLQSGVVPPPKTAYENVFILGIGDSVEITSNNGCVILTFKHDFPFLNANRLSPAEMQPDEDLILKMIAEATIERIDDTKPTYLFHSAGKDSNTIALALAEAGLQDKVTLITHQSKGDSDESHISKEIADRLGFKHEILHESIDLNSAHKQEIEAYFESAPFPVTDNATLAYPLYLAQKPELKNANIIDGSGNDVYIGHIPSSTEFKRQKFSAYFSKLRPLTKYAQSESFLHILGRARSEWVGLSGISYADTKKILNTAYDTSNYWYAKDHKNIHFDYLDHRGDIRGCMIDTETFQRKARNFADTTTSNLILPFTNEAVASYFAQMPETYLFDRKLLKNKLILRKILKERIELDSDKLGKLGYTFDFIGIIKNNWEFISHEILSCVFWTPEEIDILVNRLHSHMVKQDKRAHFSAYMIHRLFVISIWLNKNKYINNAL